MTHKLLEDTTKYAFGLNILVENMTSDETLTVTRDGVS